MRPSRAVGERTAENSLEMVVFRFSVIFLQKGIYRSALGPYNPPPPTGRGARDRATRTGRLRASVLKFFDIVDKQEGMRGQRYGV